MKMVGTTQFASMSEAKTKLPKLVDDQLSTVLLRHNEPVAAIVSIEKYNNFLVFEALKRDPQLLVRLYEQAKEAHLTPVEELRTLGDLEEIYERERGLQRSSERRGPEGSEELTDRPAPKVGKASA